MSTNEHAQALLEELFDAPLYRLFTVGSLTDATLLFRKMRTTAYKFDRYCPECGKDTTWVQAVTHEDQRQAQLERASTVLSSSRGGGAQFNWIDNFGPRMSCSRNALHQYSMFLKMERRRPTGQREPTPDVEQPSNVVVTKIGQYPSLADIQLGTLKEYEEGLSVQQRREFVRAINTSAHGFNVAACVHYRRLFEGILFEARDAFMKDAGISAWPEFERMRTDERISALKAYLPQFMVEHPHFYGLLSKGVHELTEEECGEAMPVLRQAIELMIQDRVDALHREKRRAQASVMLARTVDKHKKGS